MGDFNDFDYEGFGEYEATEPYVSPEPQGPSLLELFGALLDLLDNAPTSPFSSSVRVSKDDIEYYVRAIAEALPSEIAVAQRIIKDERDILARANLDANVIREKAAQRASQMVDAHQITLDAQAKAQQIAADSKAEIRRMNDEMTTFIEGRLQQLDDYYVKMHQYTMAQLSKFKASPNPLRVTSLDTPISTEPRGLDAVEQSTTQAFYDPNDL